MKGLPKSVALLFFIPTQFRHKRQLRGCESVRIHAGFHLPKPFHQPQSPGGWLPTINVFHAGGFQFVLDAHPPVPRLAQHSEFFGFDLLLIGASSHGRSMHKPPGNEMQFPASGFGNRANEKPNPANAKVGRNRCKFDLLMNRLAVDFENQFKAGFIANGVQGESDG